MTYRNDIDGLRAIAVFAVIFFHAGAMIPGGFVGVDVFFVISGFLITSIILKESKNNNFSLINFWARRIRRILPLASFVSLVTLLFGYVILSPQDYLDLSKSGLAQSFFSANIYFYKGVGYFSQASELKPLLHMWSLSIEEQFYFFYPFFIIPFLSNKKSLYILLIFLTASSFVLNLVLIKESPVGTFYLLPTRAWELSIGGLIALLAKEKSYAKFSNILDFLGISFIGISFILYDKSYLFPGIYALIPVIGTSLLLLPKSKETYISKFLSISILRFLGKISFSLYLWHWPILAYKNHILIDQSDLKLWFYLGLLLALSYLSWMFIEEPFRRSKILKNYKICYCFGIFLVILVIVPNLIVYKQGGFLSRFSSEENQLFEDIHYVGQEYDSQWESEGVSIGAKSDSSTIDFVLWGDSHGKSIVREVDSLAQEFSLHGKAFLRAGVTPITNLWAPLHPYYPKEDVLNLNEERLDYIINNKILNVVLVCRWQHKVWGLKESEMTNRENPKLPLVVDSKAKELNHEESFYSLRRQYEKMIFKLLQNDIKVFVLTQVPVATRPEIARDFCKYKLFGKFNEYSNLDNLSKEEFLKSREKVYNMLNSIEHKNYKILDPVDLFFNKNGTLVLSEEKSIFRDEDHLTPFGSKKLRPLFIPIFNEMKK